MNFLNAITNRYTTKMYDSNKKISPETINELKNILHLCPSSINGQPWQFTFVRDENTKNKLAEVSFFNIDKVKNCDTLIVFSAIDKIVFFEKQINENLSQYAIDYFNRFLKGKKEIEIKNWFQKQVYLALGVILSACATMQIDATPMEGIDFEKYNEIVNPDGNYATTFAVAIGFRDANDSNQLSIKPKTRIQIDKIIKNI